jgi:hypothetical protein
MDIFFATTRIELVWLDMTMTNTDTFDKNRALLCVDAQDFTGTDIYFFCFGNDLFC